MLHMDGNPIYKKHIYISMFLTLIPKYVLLEIPKHKTHEIDYQTKFV